MEATNDLNYDSYLAHAIEIFNDRMDAGFSGDDIILTCFMTCGVCCLDVKGGEIRFIQSNDK